MGDKPYEDFKQRDDGERVSIVGMVFRTKNGTKSVKIEQFVLEARTDEKPPAATDGSSSGITDHSAEIVKNWTPLNAISVDDLKALPLDVIAERLYKLIETGRTYDEIRTIGQYMGIFACHGKCN